MSDAAISCQKLERYLGKNEGRTRVLKGVTFSAEVGKIYSIVGPSGCGKSTLLYLLGLLDRPDGGRIQIGTRDVSSLTDGEATAMRNELLGFVFQFHFLIKEFTAAENIMLPMQRLGKASPEEMRARSLELLREVGLEEKADRRANHLSGGEQQRVAIARSLANNPQVLLADEPTGNLDSKNSERVFSLLEQIVHEQRKCLVLVTHNPEIAERCDHTLEMADGDIVSMK